MAKTPLLQIRSLSAILDAQLHQFGPMEPDEDDGYSAPSQPEMKKNPLLRAGMAGATVAGAGAIAANKDKIKAGYQAGKETATEAGRTAVFRGMRKTAGVMNKGAKVAEKVSGKAYLPAVQKGADLLRKGAKSLRKNSMKFFDADLAARCLRIDAKLRQFERGL